MGLRDKLKKLRGLPGDTWGGAGDVLGGAADIAGEAKDFLAQHAPSLLSAGEAATRVARLGIAAPTGNLFTDLNPYPLDLRRPWAAPLAVQSDIQAVGHGALAEPLSYGIAALGGNEQPGGPFSGTQFGALERGARELPGPARYAGMAGTTALGFVTDPSNYLALGAGMEAGAARGVGGALAKEALTSAKFGALSGLGSAAGADIASRLGASRETGEAVGGLAAPLGAGLLGARGRPPVLSAAAETPAAAATEAAAQPGPLRRGLARLREQAGLGPSDRYYHGTGSAFPAPEAGKFDPNGLFGPGYYLTSDARVAEGYAGERAAIHTTADYPGDIAFAENLIRQRQAELKGLDPASPRAANIRQHIANLEQSIAETRADAAGAAGPNIRPVDVPRSLRLFDVEAPLSPAATGRILSAWRDQQVEWFKAHWRQYFDESERPAPAALDDWARERADRITEAVRGDLPGAENGAQFLKTFGGAPDAKATMNRALAEAGYDGIRYAGGQRTPLMDAAGRPIEHTALVIFPESLPKIRNALSGTAMGIVPPEVARRTGVPVAVPADPAFRAAVERAGGRVTPEGVGFPLRRFQPKDAPGVEPLRGAVFYEVAPPAGVPERTPYRTSIDMPGRVGGTQSITGTTLVRRPLVVDTSLGEGRAFMPVEVALARLDPRVGSPEQARGLGLLLRELANGVQDARNTLSDATSGIDQLGWSRYQGRTLDEVRASLTEAETRWAREAGMVLRAYGAPDPEGLARRILEVHRWEPSEAQWAVLDRAAADAARAAGYDSIIGYRPGGGIDELIDLREGAYPTPAGGFTLRPEYGARVLAGSPEAAGVASDRVSIGTSSPRPGLPPLPPDALNALTGAGLGALAPADTKEERARNALLGAGLAVGGGRALGALPAVRRGVAAAEELHQETAGTLGNRAFGTGAPLGVAEKAAQAPLPGFGQVERKLPDTWELAGKVATTPLRLARETALGGDPGQMIRYTVIGTMEHLGARGLRGVASAGGAFWNAAKAVRSARNFDAYRQSERWAQMAPYVRAAGGGLAAYTGEGSLMERIAASRSPWALLAKPVAVPLAGLERATFERFLPVYATETAGQVYDALRTARGFRDLPAAELKALTGERVSRLLVGMDPNALPNPLRSASRLALLAPNYTAGQLWNAAGVFRSGPEGMAARRFWAAAALSAVTASVGLSLAFGGKSPDEVLDPKDGVWNPASPNFLAVALPGGRSVQPFSAVWPVARALLRPVARSAREGYDAYDAQRTKDVALRDAVLAGIWGGLSALPGETGESAKRLALTKASIPVRLLNELVVTGRDFWGNEIATADTAGGRLAQRAEYVGKAFLPVFASPFTEQRPAAPGAAPSGADQAVAMVSNWLLNTDIRAPQRYPAPVEADARAALADLGAPAGDDPIAAYRAALRGVDADRRAALERKYPQADAFTKQLDILQGAKADIPRGRAAYDTYRAMQRRYEQWRDDQLRALEAQNLPGDEYRRRRGDVMDRYRLGVEGAAATLAGTSDPDAVRAWVDKVYSGAPRSDDAPVRRALDAYHAIRPADDSPEARDAMFEQQRAYLKSLGPDLEARVRQQMLDTAPTDTERGLIRAQWTMGDAPGPYVGMDAAEARTVSGLVGQARDLARLTGLPQRTALLQVVSRQRPPDGKAYVLAKLVMQGKLRNPARAAFLRQNAPLLGRYYSSLGSELLDQIA